MRRLAVLACALLACGTPQPAPTDLGSSDLEVAATDGAIADAAQPSLDAATPCGTRAGQRGLTHRTVTVAGRVRTYLVYLPASADASKPLPLVLVFHGYSMSGQAMHDITGYEALADKEGIAVLFPDGQAGPDAVSPPWNVQDSDELVCGAGQGESAPGDDFAFIDAMKADVAEDQCTDAAHVFATGFSMGGYMAHHIGCHRADVRAVAPHSGGAPAYLDTCTTGHVPIIIFHGTLDPLIVDACDDPTQPAVSGFPASAAQWAEKNGCADTYKAVTTQAPGGGFGTCYTWDGCPSDGQVELCTFAAMGHCWSGGTPVGVNAEFACPLWKSATQLEWDFWKQHAW